MSLFCELDHYMISLYHKPIPLPMLFKYLYCIQFLRFLLFLLFMNCCRSLLILMVRDCIFSRKVSLPEYSEQTFLTDKRL